MNDRYKFVERAVPQTHALINGLSVEKNSSAAFRIYRMLCGSCDVYDEFSQKKFRLRRDYLRRPYNDRSNLSVSALLDNFPAEMELSYLVSYFAALKANDEFYSLIEFELTSCLIARKRENYLEAFVFLYRILEGVSYAIPLLYMSRSKSFQKTFRSLQQCMPGSEKEGELLFFRKFIDTHWSTKGFYPSIITIDLMSVDIEELRPKYYSIFRRYAPAKGIEIDEEDDEIGIRFPYFLDFLISIRNRYFHFLQGTWQQNIESGEIVFPDLFFAPLIDIGINWIGTCLFEVLKFDLDNHA